MSAVPRSATRMDRPATSGSPRCRRCTKLPNEATAKDLGHPDVSIYGGWSRVMSIPGEFGYGFSERNYAGPVPVDWTVTARLWAVDGEGATIEEVGHTGRFLKVIDADHQPHIGLTPPTGAASTASTSASRLMGGKSGPTRPTSSWSSRNGGLASS